LGFFAIFGRKSEVLALGGQNLGKGLREVIFRHHAIFAPCELKVTFLHTLQGCLKLHSKTKHYLFNLVQRAGSKFGFRRSWPSSRSSRVYFQRSG
jgi:hypothetical protein